MRTAKCSGRLAEVLDAAVTLLHVVTPPGHAASRTDQRADGSIAHLRADRDAYLRSATERFASPRTNVSIRTAIADRAAPCERKVMCRRMVSTITGERIVSRRRMKNAATGNVDHQTAPACAVSERCRTVSPRHVGLPDFSLRGMMKQCMVP
jgi:hypothetical protein